MSRLLLYFSFILLLFSCKTDLNKKQTQKQKAVDEFNINELDLLNNGDTTTPFRVLKITNLKDSLLLRKQSRKVTFNKGDSLLKVFSQRLVATVQDSSSLGVGIAAPQVGFLKNIICVQRFDKEAAPFEVYYNPEITQYSKKTQPCKEGCLSIPGRMDTLTIRSYAILLEYNDIKGAHQYEMVEDFTAVIFQHEIDHLKGVLYIDYLHEKAHAEGKKHEHRK
jgi:peptide deformylase